MAKKSRARQAKSHLQGLTLFATKPPKWRVIPVGLEQPDIEPQVLVHTVDVRDDENFLVLDDLVTHAAISTQTISTPTMSSSVRPTESNDCPPFNLGDHIEVYAGAERIAEGSYIESSDELLVWVDVSGNVRFTFLGGRISIVKV